MKARHLRDGKWAEDYADRYLRRQGLKAIDRNVNCRAGEIDLVMSDGEELVFVEVRYRRGTGYLHPADTIGNAKRRRLVLAIEWFLKKHPHWMSRPMRIDAFLITGNPPDVASEWIRDAFEAPAW